MQGNQPTIVRPLLWLLAAVITLAACKSDDSVATTTAGDYCYIKSVTLGTVKRVAGSVTTSFPAGTFEMTVDHRSLTIENRDSLPYGSQLGRVTATIAFDGSTLSYREKGAEAGWTSYNATDSLDLTHPLELLLASGDNQTQRIYTLKVNVHRQEGDSIRWDKCESDSRLASMTDMKAFTLGGQLLVLGKTGADIVLLQRPSADTQATWLENTTSGLPETTDLQTLRQHDSFLYLSTSDGQILTSTDAKQWQQVGNTLPGGLTLIERSDNYFYAISEGKLLRSADASTWEEDKLDADASLLPASDVRTLTLHQANGNSRIVMVGQREGSAHAVVWNKMWNDSEREADSEWTYFPLTPDNQSPCPPLQHMSLLHYDGKCIALGGPTADGNLVALNAMYVSRDYGITWQPDTQHALPAQLIGSDGCIACTVDQDNFIWIITNTQIWRGRLFRLGFAQP